jgi:hypothetical protein
MALFHREFLSKKVGLKLVCQETGQERTFEVSVELSYNSQKHSPSIEEEESLLNEAVRGVINTVDVDIIQPCCNKTNYVVDAIAVKDCNGYNTYYTCILHEV